MGSGREKAEIKVGCCGFVISQKKYFRLFRLIEIQSTFYQLPELKTAEKWRASSPAGFEFTPEGKDFSSEVWALRTFPTHRRSLGSLAANGPIRKDIGCHPGPVPMPSELWSYGEKCGQYAGFLWPGT
jgi:hypothetical protein